MNNKYETLLTMYHKVFNEDKSIKICGRAACKDLILECSKHNPDVNFGDLRTGFMNVENIHKLVDSINDK